MAIPAIPTDDTNLQAYSYNWRVLLTATPLAFGLIASDAVAITTLVNNFTAALVVAQAPETRTEVSVADKNYKKALLLILLRQQYRLIKANPAVSVENKTAIGVRINDPVPTPIPAPTTSPVFVARNNGPRSMLMDWKDQLTPLSRRKPEGTIGIVLVKKIGTSPASDPADCEFEGVYSRAPVGIDTFPPDSVGKYATFYSRWVTSKGLEGPWSAAFSQIISN